VSFRCPTSAHEMPRKRRPRCDLERGRAIGMTGHVVQSAAQNARRRSEEKQKRQLSRQRQQERMSDVRKQDAAGVIQKGLGRSRRCAWPAARR